MGLMRSRSKPNYFDAYIFLLFVARAFSLRYDRPIIIPITTVPSRFEIVDVCVTVALQVVSEGQACHSDTVSAIRRLFAINFQFVAEWPT
jgi:hypothetical protein